MNQPINDMHADLFSRIITALENGGRLTGKILDYIDGVLFPPEPGHLAAFLSDENNSERDSLLDLIFYPDQAFQMDMEPLLERARYSVDDEAALRAQLMAHTIHAPVNMPDGSPLTRILVPDFVKSHYLARLKISWQPDPVVTAAIDHAVTPRRRLLIKVRLRNADVCFSPEQRVFMGRFFERMVEDDSDYLACLDLVLSTLERAGDKVDIYDQLAGYKRFLFRSLQQAKRFETLLRRSNMETLMLQGVRAPHAPRDELAQRIRLIDRICIGIFGKTEIIDQPIEGPVRQVTGFEDPQAAVRSLLRQS